MEHRFNPSTGYKQKGHPHPVTSCGRRRSFMTSPLNKGRCWPGFKPNPDGRPAGARGSCVPVKMLDDSPFEKKKRRKSNEPRRTTKGKGRNFRTVKEGAGMTAKGVATYRRKNPGSKLKTAVTGKVKPGSKAAKRRKSFCARSRGWTSERGKAARRRWRC